MDMQRIKQILATEPDILRMFGLDPDVARREVEKQEAGE